VNKCALQRAGDLQGLAEKQAFFYFNLILKALFQSLVSPYESYFSQEESEGAAGRW
jgi:hypothetical protein